MIASGNSIKEIGSKLRISPRTVDTFLDKINKKLKTRNGVMLTHYALYEKLISIIDISKVEVIILPEVAD